MILVREKKFDERSKDTFLQLEHVCKEFSISKRNNLWKDDYFGKTDIDYTCDKQMLWESACAFLLGDNSRLSPQVA